MNVNGDVNGDGGFHVRVSMTFSELAHPAFVRTLRRLPSRGRSRLIHALVERGLSLGGAGEGSGLLDAFASLSAQANHSPLNALGSTGSLVGAEELGE